MNAHLLPMLLYTVFLFLIDISSSHHCHGPDDQQPCKCFEGEFDCLRSKCDWNREFSQCIELVTTSTDFPTYQPTPNPIEGANNEIIQCGDTIRDTYTHRDITFELEILSNMRSIEINACNSNYDTRLVLYDHPNLQTIIITDDNGCDNQYGSSLIHMENGLSAGTYYLILSTNTNTTQRQNGVYELHIFCDNIPPHDHDVAPVPVAEQCDSECDAFSIHMLYYGLLSEYNTSHIYYEDVHKRRRLPSQSSAVNDEHIVCYTYRIKREFDDGICAASVDSILLGICNADKNKINDQDLDALILKQYGGELYQGYHSLDVSDITGVKIDMNVDTQAIEFTLCINGANDKGLVSHTVQFKRGGNKQYICTQPAANDGLPCLDPSFSHNKNKIDISNIGHTDIDFTVGSNTKNTTFARILQVILLISLSVMIMISALYVFISQKKAQKYEAAQGTAIDWAEINVSDTLSDTEEVNDNEKDPLDLSEDIVYNKVLSKHSSACSDKSNITDKISNALKQMETTNDTENGNQNNHEIENDEIGTLKENLFDLNKKFKNNTKSEQIIKRSTVRDSVSSVVSENDGCTILPLYNDYNSFNDVVSDDGYWNNGDVYHDNANSKSDTL